MWFDILELTFSFVILDQRRIWNDISRYLRENKNFITVKNGKEQVSVAAVLLYGKNPQQFFPRAYIRFIRYDGVEARVGKDMNVIKDVIFEGRILDQVRQAVESFVLFLARERDDTF